MEKIKQYRRGNDIVRAIKYTGENQEEVEKLLGERVAFKFSDEKAKYLGIKPKDGERLLRLHAGMIAVLDECNDISIWKENAFNNVFQVVNGCDTLCGNKYCEDYGCVNVKNN